MRAIGEFEDEQCKKCGGRLYKVDGGGLCVHILEDKTEIYDWVYECKGSDRHRWLTTVWSWHIPYAPGENQIDSGHRGERKIDLRLDTGRPQPALIEPALNRLVLVQLKRIPFYLYVARRQEVATGSVGGWVFANGEPIPKDNNVLSWEYPEGISELETAAGP